ncbi:MAG: 50S ribosomal protein L37e [Methanomicrobiales archaeon]|nr:50S ribosomal protein L37e [Methanomicrobiales archaeon]MDI6876723.1 50S ribosomal protein L37e [Methanomicrobiales archaeon]
MSKGTPSMGKRQKRVHIACRRCGSISYHVRQKTCSACGFGRSTKLRGYRWANKKPKVPTH